MESGGVCAKPDCRQPLYEEFEESVVNVEELAHIISESVKGPRGDSKLSASKRNQAKNIILLCPRCHTLVDKSPGEFPPRLLHRWKSQHKETIKQTFHAKRFYARKELCRFLEPIFGENRALWENYGPYSQGAENPYADHYATWQKVVIEKIIPNNRMIDVTLMGNVRFLSRKEMKLLGFFKVHREAFEFNHLSGDKTTNAPLFPTDLPRRLFGYA
jgi:hypothetical protein